ncbi:MAG: hypothetical protein A2V98_04850 [Planctomycetes bacterium RBG_16_64_12]|nr:MAG: hypothetical protein A2V98_04850 [Planctomycetes bacterium RBG_16_64_12]
MGMSLWQQYWYNLTTDAPESAPAVAPEIAAAHRPATASGYIPGGMSVWDQFAANFSEEQDWYIDKAATVAKVAGGAVVAGGSIWLLAKLAILAAGAVVAWKAVR